MRSGSAGISQIAAPRLDALSIWCVGRPTMNSWSSTYGPQWTSHSIPLALEVAVQCSEFVILTIKKSSENCIATMSNDDDHDDGDKKSVSPQEVTGNPILAAPTAASSLQSKLSTPTLPYQLDALILDQYLISLLVPRCQSMLRHAFRWIASLPIPSSWSSTSTALPSTSTIQSILSFITLFYTNGQTPAVKQLGLQLVTNPHEEIANHHRAATQTVPSKFSFRHRLMVYSFLSIVVPWLYDKIRQRWLLRIQQYHLQHTQQQDQRRRLEEVIHEDEEEEDDQEQQRQEIRRIANQRQVYIMENFIQVVDTLIPTSKLLVLLLSWLSYSTTNNNDTQTTQRSNNDDDHDDDTLHHQPVLLPSNFPPSLAMWLAGLRFTRQQHQQQQQISTSISASNATTFPPPVHVLYGHRRWMTDEFLRLGPLVVIPLMNVVQETRILLSSWWWLIVPPLRRRVSHLLRKNLPKSIHSKLTNDTKPTTTELDGCPVCGMDPIGIPYQVKPCGHVYCYTCVWERLQQQQQHFHLGNQQKTQSDIFSNDTTSAYCPVCHERVTSCIPVGSTATSVPPPSSEA